jgi:hypothetical protein
MRHSLCRHSWEIADLLPIERQDDVSRVGFVVQFVRNTGIFINFPSRTRFFLNIQALLDEIRIDCD